MENRDGDCYRGGHRVASDYATTAGGRWMSARSDDAAEASVGGGLADRSASGSGRDAQSSYNDVMAEERLVGSAALPNGAVGCRLVDGVVVFVVVEECSRFRPTLTVCWSRVVLMKSSGVVERSCVLSGRGVVPSCNTVVPRGRGVAQGEGWSVGVLQLLVVKETRIARETLI